MALEEAEKEYYVGFWKERVASWNRTIVFTVLLGLAFTALFSTVIGLWSALIIVVWWYPMSAAIDGRKFAVKCLKSLTENSTVTSVE